MIPKLGQIFAWVKRIPRPDICLGNQEFAANAPSSNRVSGTILSLCESPFCPPGELVNQHQNMNFPTNRESQIGKFPFYDDLCVFCWSFGVLVLNLNESSSREHPLRSPTKL